MVTHNFSCNNPLDTTDISLIFEFQWSWLPACKISVPQNFSQWLFWLCHMYLSLVCFIFSYSAFFCYSILCQSVWHRTLPPEVFLSFQFSRTAHGSVIESGKLSIARLCEDIILWPQNSAICPSRLRVYLIQLS